MSNNDWTPEGAKDLQAAIGMAVGSASTCWEHLEGTGIYQSEQAQSIVNGLMDWMDENTEHRPTAEQKARLWAAKTAAGVIRAKSLINTASVDWIEVISLAEFLLTEPEGQPVAVEAGADVDTGTWNAALSELSESLGADATTTWSHLAAFLETIGVNVEARA